MKVFGRQATSHLTFTRSRSPGRCSLGRAGVRPPLRPAAFDSTKSMTVSLGTIKMWRWANPHPEMRLIVDAAGSTRRRAVRVRIPGALDPDRPGVQPQLRQGRRQGHHQVPALEVQRQRRPLSGSHQARRWQPPESAWTPRSRSLGQRAGRAFP